MRLQKGNAGFFKWAPNSIFLGEKWWQNKSKHFREQRQTNGLLIFIRLQHLKEQLFFLLWIDEKLSVNFIFFWFFFLRNYWMIVLNRAEWKRGFCQLQKFGIMVLLLLLLLFLFLRGLFISFENLTQRGRVDATCCATWIT